MNKKKCFIGISLFFVVVVHFIEKNEELIFFIGTLRSKGICFVYDLI